MEIRVTIRSFRNRLLDTDNCIGGAKALRDLIAAEIGIDDGDPRIQWVYEQVKSTTTGTMITIEY